MENGPQAVFVELRDQKLAIAHNPRKRSVRIVSQQAIIITREFDRQRDHFDAEFLAMADRSAVAFAEGSDSSQPWSPEDLRDTIRGWFAQHDPEQVELQAAQQQARRACSVRVHDDGMVALTALLPAPEGAAVMQFLDANASPRTRMSAPDRDSDIDMRTRKQKMADALVRAFTTAAKSKDTSSQGGAAPTLLVTVPMREITKYADGKPALARVSRTQEFVPVAEVSRIVCDGKRPTGRFRGTAGSEARNLAQSTKTIRQDRFPIKCTSTT